MQTTYMSFNYEWIMKIWYIYALGYYCSAVKKTEIKSFAGEWTELEKMKLPGLRKTHLASSLSS